MIVCALIGVGIICKFIHTIVLFFIFASEKQKEDPKVRKETEKRYVKN